MSRCLDPNTGRARIGFDPAARDEVLETANMLAELTGRAAEVVTCEQCERLHVVSGHRVA